MRLGRNDIYLEACIYICDHCLLVVIVIRWGGLIGWGAGQCLSVAMVIRWDGIIARLGCGQCFFVVMACHTKSPDDGWAVFVCWRGD